MLFPFLFALAQAPVAAPMPIESLPPLVEGAQAISPDHERIAIATRDEGVWVLDIATRTVALRIAPTDSVVQYVTWNAVGSALALLHRNANIEVLDAATGSGVTTAISTGTSPADWETREIHFAAGDPSGHLLAIGGGDCDAYLWCRTQQRVVRKFSHCDVEVFSTQGIGSVAFNTDGTRLLTTTFSYWDMRVWDLSSDRLLDHFDFYDYPAPLQAWFSSDGTRIAWASDTVTTTFDDRHPIPKDSLSDSFAKALPRVPPSRLVWWEHDRDYAWAVVDHNLVVRKVPDEQPILKIAVRAK